MCNIPHLVRRGQRSTGSLETPPTNPSGTGCRRQVWRSSTPVDSRCHTTPSAKARSTAALESVVTGHVYMRHISVSHYDVFKWKRFPRYWPFARGIHRSPVDSHHKGPVTRSFGVSFDLHLNKRLSKQSRRQWDDTPSHSLWRHCNATELKYGLWNLYTKKRLIKQATSL